mmetsp:Transcript_9498/g.13966  ORF Transcript_9498/g.13966 Transcript_9498/m.13966 type:complete len:287 (-) Transcript_9498:159-1019(-)|eukprot:CAMPEP_0197235142 /NCGR_PEP_ID=MMETSP1429-20130617/2639_1 /TAXON_ID=49237 /ORGANISM="Chaetoceros  sp., Strain UNC1202" /LENGTH=286 /DNA_ID=CAMNT_0042693663 /DNA_START=94 /DNA_END=954 /DNA_ORIENTATION=+
MENGQKRSSNGANVILMDAIEDAAAPAPNPSDAPKHDRFLSTMTFANSMAMGGCDCDECDECNEPSIPTDISDAIQQHKRKKLLFSGSYIITNQERKLVKRWNGGGVSIWKFTMPPGSEPLVEFGNSHRIVLVERLPKGRSVKLIGQGIIGSSDEGKSRKEVHWRSSTDKDSSSAYLYRSNGGRAIGWINEKLESDRDLNVNDERMDVVVYVVKATLECVRNHQEKESNRMMKNTTDAWSTSILEVFESYSSGKEVDNQNNTGEELDGDDAATIRKVIDGVLAHES